MGVPFQKIRKNPQTPEEVQKAINQIADTLNALTFVVSDDGMTKNPETDTEDGYLQLTANGKTYQLGAHEG
jgi:hypothetical protein